MVYKKNQVNKAIELKEKHMVTLKILNSTEKICVKPWKIWRWYKLNKQEKYN